MNLKELARELGLSQTTVSRALNGYPEVAETTRRRVTEAAERLSYRPNTRARSLATGRAMAIGHVIPLATRHEIMNPIFADFIAGAGEVYSQRGYEMLLSVVSEPEEERVYRELASKASVDGIIVHAPRVGDRRIALLNEVGLPFVVHGRTSASDDSYSWVDVNNRRAFQRATDFLLDLGHRRIGLVNGIETMDFAARRRDGHLRALRARDVPVDDRLLRAGEMTESHGYRAARALMELDPPPTAFLVASMISALGIRRAIEEMGFRMGRDISIVTFDDHLSYLRNGEDIPIFTAVRASVREMGRTAAEMLIERIADRTLPVGRVLIEAELTVGQSTGPVAPRGPALETGSSGPALEKG